MMRGAEVLFASILAVTVLRRVLRWPQWTAVGLIMVRARRHPRRISARCAARASLHTPTPTARATQGGLALVGTSSVLGGGQDRADQEPVSRTQLLAGILLLLFSNVSAGGLGGGRPLVGGAGVAGAGMPRRPTLPPPIPPHPPRRCPRRSSAQRTTLWWGRGEGCVWRGACRRGMLGLASAAGSERPPTCPAPQADVDLEPMELVGWEGVWGTLFMFFWLIILYVGR
jgi:hypothetical protein